MASNNSINNEINIIGKGDFIERNNDKVYFTFGRFQPPTIGHKILINSIENKILENDNKADGYVFISKKQNDPLDKMIKKRDVKKLRDNISLFPEFVKKSTLENPLSVYEKTYFLKKMYPNTNVKFINTEVCKIQDNSNRLNEIDSSYYTPCGGIFNIIGRLITSGYNDITMIVGSDRVEAFSKLVNRINEKRLEEGKNPINVESVGLERDENDDSLRGMSGSKMRIASVMNDYTTFYNGIQTYDNDEKANLNEEEILYLMKAIKEGVGLINNIEDNENNEYVNGNNKSNTIRRSLRNKKGGKLKKMKTRKLKTKKSNTKPKSKRYNLRKRKN